MNPRVEHKFKVIGQSGQYWMLVGLNSTSDQDPAVVISYDVEYAPRIRIEEKYDMIATPMTFNAYESFSPDQTDIATDFILQQLTNDQITDINSFLAK